MLAAIASLSLLNISCEEEEKVTTPPTYKGFTITPAEVHPGDKVVVTAHYANRGEYWYAPECSWSFVLDTVNTESSQQQPAIYRQLKQQSVGDETLTTSFIVPQNAAAPCRIRCTLNVAMNTAVTTKNVKATFPNTTEPGYEGQFEPSYISSTLFCSASGTVNFTVTPK